jgi:amidase
VASLPYPRPQDFGAFVPDDMCGREATGTGVLDGLTFAVKDLIDVVGCRTGAGNPDWLAGQAPAERSAEVVENTLAAGATLIGKTITDELAFSLEGRNIHYGSPINPACPKRICGGSSSGSGVAVAAGLVDFAIGTDTGGSVRVPANFLGLFGFRPSHGAISLDGVVPFAPSYDTVGWFAPDAGLLANIGRALLPAQKAEAITTLKLARDAFALVDRPLSLELQAEAESWGVSEIVDIFNGEEVLYLDCYQILQNAEVWKSLGPWITENQPSFAADIGQRFAGAAGVTPAQVKHYQPVRSAIRARFEALVPSGTALVIPTTPCLPLPIDASEPSINDFYRRALTLTAIAGHCGAPQVAVPLGRWQGCPIGLSIVGARGSDAALFQLAIKLDSRGTGFTAG